MVRVWWPGFIRKPRLRLTKPSLKMPEKPSGTTLFTLTLIFLLFVFGGGVWDIVYKDTLRSMGSTSSGGPLLIYPSLDYQFIIEGLVASILLFAGFIGLIIIYQSTRHVYRPSYSKLLLVAGMGLLFTSYILLNVMLGGKFQS
jgi:hypothetical protein